MLWSLVDFSTTGKADRMDGSVFPHWKRDQLQCNTMDLILISVNRDFWGIGI